MFIVSGIVLVHGTFVSLFVARQEAWWVEVLFSENRCDYEQNKTSAGYEEHIFLVGFIIRVTKGCRSNSLNLFLVIGKKFSFLKTGNISHHVFSSKFSKGFRKLFGFYDNDNKTSSQKTVFTNE